LRLEPQTVDPRVIPSASDCRIYSAGRLLLDDKEVRCDVRRLALHFASFFQAFCPTPARQALQLSDDIVRTSSAASRSSDLPLCNCQCPENQKEIAFTSVNHHFNR
jgi:hypothetical protein